MWWAPFFHMTLWKEHGNYFSGGCVCCWWSVKLPAGQDILCSILHWLSSGYNWTSTEYVCVFHIITVAYTNVHAHRPKQVMAWSHILRKMSHKNGSIYINGIITNNNHCTVIFHYNGWLLDPARCRLSTMRASGNRSQLPCFPKQANPLTTKLF